MRLSVIHHLVLATMFFSIIMITGILILSHFAVISGIEKIEKEAAPQTAEKILAVLSLESDTLARLAYDWGVWDDTYSFMGNRSEQYIVSNLNVASLTGIQVNDILFFDSKGSLKYKVSVDYRNGNVRQTSDDLVSYIQKKEILGPDALAQTGIIPLQTGPVLIATHPILMSDEGGPSRGTILMSRDLDEARIAYLSGYTLYPFKLERNNHLNQSEDYNEEQPAFLSVLNTSDNTITTLNKINDISGNPTYLARMDIPFNSPYTKEFVWMMILLVASLSTLFFITILLYYRYYLARHISGLSFMLDEAVRTGSLSETLSTQAPSEITRLAESAERVTLSLIQNRHDLHRSTDELEEAEERWQILFEEAIDPMCVGNEDGIINANRSWVRLFGCTRAEVVNIPLRDLTLPQLQDGTDPMISLIRQYYSVPDEGFIRFDWRISVPDEGEKYSDVTIKRIRFRGEILRFVVARDITIQVQMQEEQAVALARIDDNLVQLGSLNDEIRNPLTIICGLLEIGECEHTDAILLEVQKIDTIIDRLDRGYVGSEKVRSYLKRSFELGRR